MKINLHKKILPGILPGRRNWGKQGGKQGKILTKESCSHKKFVRKAQRKKQAFLLTEKFPEAKLAIIQLGKKFLLQGKKGK